MTNYQKYRGKCKEMCDDLILQNPNLTLVRGHYFCPVWNSNEPHWWCEDVDGNIHDPSVMQFPSVGCGVYTKFDGNCICENCGVQYPESKDGSTIIGRHTVCSGKCAMELVGLI